MKLGLLLDHIGEASGGAERHSLALLRRAAVCGHDAMLATLKGPGPSGIQTLVIRAPRARPERDQVFAQEGVRALRAAGCHVVLAVRHATQCDVYLPHGGLVDDARAAHDRSRAGPTWLTRVARAFSRKHAFFQQAEAALLGGSQGPLVICVSQQLAERVKQRYPPAAGRVFTVPNGVDSEAFTREAHLEAGRQWRARLQLPQDALLLLLLANDPVLKGAAAALELLAHPITLGLGRPVHLLLAGARFPRALSRRARRLGVRARLHTPGPVADPRPLYAAADLLVHPTWYDPCSLVCLEALSMSLPVITTPPNGVRELMGQRGGIVVEAPGDPEALAAAVRVLADDSLRAFTRDDARYVALKNREVTRLDRILELCVLAARERAGVAAGARGP